MAITLLIPKVGQVTARENDAMSHEAKEWLTIAIPLIIIMAALLHFALPDAEPKPPQGSIDL